MHGADYNPDQWLHDPAILQEDLRLMKLAGCNVMSVGIFSWSALEKREGEFDFGWLDSLLDSFLENGIFAWLATPSGARPAWMSAKYPEVLRVGKDRARNLHGGRHNHCYTSPVYRNKIQVINTKLAQKYSSHPAVLGWHISNEYGGECYCDLCEAGFRTWLKKKYGTLDTLNFAWWTAFWSHTYNDWEQIEAPAPHGERMVHGLNLDWHRFVSDQTIDFCRHEINAVRAAGSDLPVTANFMEWTDFEDLDYFKFANELDVISWDAYPTWHEAEDEIQVASKFAFNHDLFRSLLNKPFLLMESTPSLTNWQPVSKLKRPGMHRLSSLQAIAHGSDSVQYFQWRKSRGSSEKFHGAVVDHVGHENTRVFTEVAELGKMLAELTEIVGTEVAAEVAIITDYDNRWAVKDSQGPRNQGVHYEETIHQHYRAFWKLGIPVDVIDSRRDLSKYKLVVAPMMYMTSEEAGRKIEHFVENGGTFVTTYWSGIVDSHDLCHLGGFPGPLRKTLGIWSEELEGLYDEDSNNMQCLEGNTLGLEGSYELHEICDLIHLEGAKALAVYGQDFYQGRPALTEHGFGKGKAYYMAARGREPFYKAFYASLADRLELKRVLESELPEGVSVQQRSSAGNDYLFVMNFSGREQLIHLDDRDYTDMESGQLAEDSFQLPVHGCRILKRSL